ncbi:hypothetical protein KCU89_g9912, partial [Aureobasidium melanogenum]
MPDVLKCPKCDANADVTKDGKWAHCASCKCPIHRTSRFSFAASSKPFGLPLHPIFPCTVSTAQIICRVIVADVKNIGNNIFQPSESPDVKEGEKDESK